MAFYTKEFYDCQKSGSLSSATAVVPYVMELINPTSVVDVGCGLGTWLSVFKQHGVKQCVGIDGSYVKKEMLLIDEAEFLQRDLQYPLAVGRTFDLAVSLEVAEHLLASSAASFVKSLTEMAPVVLFSAAVPAQTGEGHVNEQWPDYWKSLFAKYDYCLIDCLRGKFWKDANVDTWYKQNMFLYVREPFICNYPRLTAFVKGGEINPLSIIHPDYYMARTHRAFHRPWFAVYSYYRELLAEAAKRTMPRNYVLAIKKIKRSLRNFLSSQ